MSYSGFSDDVRDNIAGADFYPAIVDDVPIAEHSGNTDIEDLETIDGAEESQFTTFGDVPDISIEEIVQSKVSKKIRDLREFLSDGTLITEKSNQTTNLINVSEKKTYCLPDTKVEEFFTILDDCRREKRMLHYSERQETSLQSHSGIMIDFDRYQKSKDPEITEKHFSTLVGRICKILFDIIDPTEHADATGQIYFHVFIIRKPEVVAMPIKNPKDTPIYKDGFHILIPDVQIMKGAKKYLLDEIINRGIMKAVFRDIPHTEEPEKMLDKMSASNPVHFLGNSKPGKPAYNLVLAYEFSIYAGDDEFSRVDLNVKDLLEGKNPNGGDINLTYETSLSFSLLQFAGKPVWLSKRQFKCKQALETKLQLLVEKTAGGLIQENDLAGIESSVDILTMGNAEAKYIQNLLSIMDISYATEYEKWFKVICAIAYTSPNYKPLAVWFSQRAPEKWSPHEVDRVWAEALNGRYSRTPITKRSIIFWARESSPQRFREIEKENYIEILSRYTYQNEGRVEHSMAARVVHAMISEKFIVDTGAKDSGRTGYIWWEFVAKGQQMKKGEIYKWRREADPDNVHLFISEHLPKIYDEQRQRIRERKDKAEDEARAKYWANVEKTFMTYMSRLSNDAFQAGIVRQAQYRFRVRGFADELDTYEDVIGVGNGVLKTGLEPKLITGFHEYKISKYTETEYVPYNPNCRYQQELLQWSKDIFPETDVNLFMWLHASTGVTMYEAACILLLLVGGGQNGKTSWAKMIHNTLGNMYAAAGKATLLTSPMERGDSANSAQMQMRSKTFVYMDEFNQSVTLNDARIKSVVTPGWQSGRDLHEKQTNFKNTCNPMALSNFDFGVRTTDHGTWRRIYYYKAKMKFCKNPNKDNPYERKGNTAWESKNPNDPNYKSAMLALLVHFNQILWRDYGGDLKNVPVPTIMRETEDFRDRQDILNKFISISVVKSPGCEITSLQTLAQKYAEWVKRSVRGEIIAQQEAELMIENSRIGPYLEYRMSGVKYLIDHRIRNQDEPPREGEQMLIEYEREREKLRAAEVIPDYIPPPHEPYVPVPFPKVVEYTPEEPPVEEKKKTRKGKKGTENLQQIVQDAIQQAIQPLVQNVLQQPNVQNEAPPIVQNEQNEDGLVRDLLRNAPKHIQNTTDKKDDNDGIKPGEIDNLLSGL